MVRVEVVGIMSFFVLAPAVWGLLLWRVPWFTSFHDELGVALKFVVALEWLALTFAVCGLFLRLGWAVTA